MIGDVDYNAATILNHLADVTAAHIRRHLQTTNHKVLAETMAENLDRVCYQTPKLEHHCPRIVRGLRHAQTVFALPVAQGHKNLTQSALAAFAHVNWSEYYAENDWTRPFLADFASGEGIGPNGVLLCDDLILGLFILGPNTLYPSHAHPAEEFYIVLSGEAKFQAGVDGPYTQRSSGDLIIHRENEAHAIWTNDKPLFAVYGWIGAISEPSWH
ncbi:cupin domain-containing protein [Amylibacter sp. SFDW26]|uniref:dimethylsulfonioproprionate lyase family protein n=1 Tax=Amylibacter sp. SFDW26 TaxID=2652722 RepID=UPI0012614EDB|nr:dimethylsulfonioproprionate lyase family protein [Amylibacter sp. SFDW26]KAB7615324.1 cupin domain-containing protein [Amylibacter sp. SFDW26]